MFYRGKFLIEWFDTEMREYHANLIPLWLLLIGLLDGRICPPWKRKEERHNPHTEYRYFLVPKENVIF